jgi:hypothetical protein
MYVDVWHQIALQQREINLTEKLWKLKLTKKTPKLVFIIDYFKISNAILTESLKTKVRLTALLHRVRK